MRRRTRLAVRGLAAAVTSTLTVALAATSVAQPVAPTNGPRPSDPAWHAIVGATIVTEPGSMVEDATIVFRDGTVTALGPDVAVPAGARTWDGEGLTITPGVVEPWHAVSAPAPDPGSPGTHWNQSVRAQVSALDGEGLSASDRSSLRDRGVVVAQIVPEEGLLRGVTAIVSLADPRDGHPDASTIRPFVGHALDIGGRGRGGYPRSKMGVIALIRQSLHDAEWLAEATAAHAAAPDRNVRPEADDAMTVLGLDLPLMVQAADEHDVLRAVELVSPFERPLVVIGNGTEFRRLDAIRDANVPMIIPVTYPSAPGVETVSDQRRATLRSLQTWEQAPTNVMRLLDAGVEVAITGSRLRRGERFMRNLRLAVEHGLDEDAALAAITTTPAELLGIDDRYGRLGVGTSASFVVTADGGLLDEDAEIRDVWVDGQRHVVEAAPARSLSGRWTIASAAMPELAATIEIGDGPSLSFEPTAEAIAAEDTEGEEDEAAGPTRIRAKSVRRVEDRLHAVVDGEFFGVDGPIVVTVIAGDDRLEGDALLPGDRFVRWTGTPAADARDEDESEDEGDDGEGGAESGDGDDDGPLLVPDLPGLPFGAFASEGIPANDATVITGGTVWTSGPAGVIDDGTVVMIDGRIRWVGPTSEVPDGVIPIGAYTIDATGKHVTPGLIDCHSHTGIAGGVNEGTQATTSEVRIGDVIDPDDVSWYRQLAGGVTAVNQLHGSANPIGGQNSVVKIRWGVDSAADMRLAGAMPGMKWALGENVKQSRSPSGTRYPRTRMGVESIMRDRLEAAVHYAAMWNRWNALGVAERAGRTPPRIDLELEAIAEIVAGERLIHCHSYRQDEILMLCRLAGEYGFTIGTFQHVLEGYKVAEAIREHAIGGSAFSDWWAFKLEVYDAIAHNGSIMHDAGVVVSFNSDSDELARRMAAEAAKAVRYGGTPMGEALKFVTINPAIQLAVDDRIGSLEAGKDADVVVWSRHPLSSRARCERTFVDGREYFSLDRDQQLRRIAAVERARIIRKVIEGRRPKDAGGAAGASRRGPRGMGDLRLAASHDHDHGFDGNLRAGTGNAAGSHDDHDHDPEDLARLAATYRYMIRNGLDPQGAIPGDCGCSIRDLLREDRS